jgi:hypothetical protein
LKKRTKKLFPVGARLSDGALQMIKVFWFFFSKKNAFLPYPVTPVCHNKNA